MRMHVSTGKMCSALLLWCRSPRGRNPLSASVHQIGTILSLDTTEKSLVLSSLHPLFRWKELQLIAPAKKTMMNSCSFRILQSFSDFEDRRASHGMSLVSKENCPGIFWVPKAALNIYLWASELLPFILLCIWDNIVLLLGWGEIFLTSPVGSGLADSRYCVTVGYCRYSSLLVPLSQRGNVWWREIFVLWQKAFYIPVSYPKGWTLSVSKKTILKEVESITNVKPDSCMDNTKSTL